MKHWWVNQNQTFAHEVGGGYLWSPKKKADGSRNYFYDSMTRVDPGDLVFSFCDTYIKAIGRVIGHHESRSKPNEFGEVGDSWSTEGWFVPVDFIFIDRPIRPKDHIESLLPLLPHKYSPLQDNGNGNQGVYLTDVPLDLAEALLSLMGPQVEALINDFKQPTTEVSEISDIVTDKVLPETQKAQLIQARIGQGLFRTKVSQIEPKCRVTGMTTPQFLIASHIKPWAKSDNSERIDGNNGLLLAPHIDHLFDKGYISFTDEGEILKSSSLDEMVLAWLENSIIPTPLNTKQCVYMEYHRINIFKE
ncbi:HNH endonuclease [Rosenbergiella epipactidis]|uniref:HNH endonuclease n=1 Tax=Rosenbergiella epipactidis TaxID=1544694 RepID=UPI001BDA8BD3|nr:HNH endonuclease [Rosenbergiella epipactidis]MBT0717795.1 HNH endonuclease [Rosenbergiella epipactidis]